MSPAPSRASAPFWSRIVRESIFDVTWNAMRDGKFALMRPVMTSTDGRCVARIRWMPAARAFCAMRATEVSTSLGAHIMRSANSSITTTMYGRRCGGAVTIFSRASASSGELGVDGLVDVVLERGGSAASAAARSLSASSFASCLPTFSL